MTTSVKTQKIKQSWDIQKMQEEAVKMVSHKIVGKIHFLRKHSAKEIDEMEKLSAHVNADRLKHYGVKTPMDLARYLAEYEVNMFGSSAGASGDEECAVLTNDKCAVWSETLRTNDFTEKEIERMQEHYSSWMKHLGHAMGFKAHIEITEDGFGSKITFKQK